MMTPPYLLEAVMTTMPWDYWLDPEQPNRKPLKSLPRWKRAAKDLASDGAAFIHPCS
jgi:hypothetical protein